MDPLRPGIPQAVAQCHRSGINVRMVTGDYLDTAIAISKEAGILTESDNLESGLTCMTGKQFQELVGGLRTEYDAANDTQRDMVGNKRAFRKV